MHFRTLTSLVCALAVGFALCSSAATAGGKAVKQRSSAKPKKLTFQRDIKPLLEQFCFDCHGDGANKGGLSLDAYVDEEAILKDRNTWEHVMNNLQARVMPPEKKPQPSEVERDLIINWIEAAVFKVDCDHPDPGRVTIRRLNRAEYNNTIRDLVGVDFQPAADFPADDSGYGFDNIGDVLSLPPVLLEKYLAAAEKILDHALGSDQEAKPFVKRFPGTALIPTGSGQVTDRGRFKLEQEGDVYVQFEFPSDGEYRFRVKAYGEQAGPDPVRMSLRLDAKDLKTFEVKAVEGAPEVYETSVQIKSGKHQFAAAYLNNYVNAKEPDPSKRDRNLVVEHFELEGPPTAAPTAHPESYRRIFVCQPTPGTTNECAREILGRFAKKAYRRPVTRLELDRLAQLFVRAGQDGESFEQSIKLALEAVLVSPHFLFRGEIVPDPDNPKAVHPINEYALASRLSYFLWSSMPDDQLFQQAERGTLRRNLEREIRRLLQSPKSKALVDNFAGQWLQTRNLKLATPDWEEFPDFDKALRNAMARETEMFFEQIVKEDRSILEFLDADYTFVNERLAKHYGISGVTGDAFQRVSLKGTHRGGLLTQGSVLTITSNPTRTSPVKRGKWVLENILGSPPPPPPPDVPELNEKKDALTGTLRQRMEQHRDKPMCASCHSRMDPIGFGLENFNAIGGWRGQDGKSPIDPSGKLISGESFRGPDELRTILLKQKKADFVRCLSEKLLTYGLGRGLEFYDRCAVNQISKALPRHQYRFSALVLEIVKSTPFQMRRGEEQKLQTAER